MRRASVILTSFTCAIGMAGCSIAGSWRVVSTNPPGAPFPAQVVTFDRNNSYTATGPEEDGGVTSTGQYRFNWFNLDILEPGNMPRTYRARRQLNGALVLTYEQRGAKVSATLVKTGR